MKLIVNGAAFEATATTLAALLPEYGVDETYTAAALNGEFVPRDERERHPLREGDRIELLQPRQGG